MRVNRNNGVTYLTFPVYDSMKNIRHCFSTRLGGVSEGIFESMNLSFGRGDSDENVRENYRRLCAAVGFDFDGIVFSAQDHNTYVRRVGRKHRGNGIARPRDMESVDGIMTNESGVVLTTHFADCIPLYFVDQKRHAIALSHAGWRGTAGRIGRVTVERMKEEFGTEPDDLICAIGPGVCRSCYEVDDDCAANFRALGEIDHERCIVKGQNGKPHLDLWEINREILIAAGVKPEKITVAGICTCCNSDELFSHRASHGQRGGLAAMMEMID
ncbi:MAG: peptidoglycan editing factor PgeF [Clostridia bacterium]|nr:peptidoglycan editing factor PgeF [Clostridia bacterium]